MQVSLLKQREIIQQQEVFAHARLFADIDHFTIAAHKLAAVIAYDTVVDIACMYCY
jgi:hypothetical protein